MFICNFNFNFFFTNCKDLYQTNTQDSGSQMNYITNKIISVVTKVRGKYLQLHSKYLQ